MQSGAITAINRGKKLIERHDRLVRKIFRKFYKVNCCVFEAERLLKLDDIYKCHDCVQMLKALKVEENTVVASSIECNFPSHDYATRNRHMVIVAFHRIDEFKINFVFAFINIWNSIESDIREARTLQIFKKKLFAYLFSKYKL